MRYEFHARPGAATWSSKEKAILDALPERLGHLVKAVVPKSGVILAAVQCQLLEYAGQAESMERSLSQTSGLTCSSRVVEPLRSESMRDAMLRLEKAG